MSPSQSRREESPELNIDDDIAWFDQMSDDDDMDGQGEGEHEDEESGGSFHDAEENLSGLELEIDFGGLDDEEEEEEGEQGQEGNQEEETADTHANNRVVITHEQIIQLLGHAGLGRLFAHGFPSRGSRRRNTRRYFDEDEAGPAGSKSKRLRGPAAFEKVPSEEGRALMNTGTFGSNPRPEDTIRRKRRLQHKIMRRELGLGSEGRQRNANRLMKQDMIPGTQADLIIHYNARCYSGQFSDDGNFFFSCAQDFRVRMYDTSNPYNWKYYKTVEYPYGQWTITDASLSPDNRLLAYSSIRSVVCLAPTDPQDRSEPRLLDFADSSFNLGYPSYFGIWSIRFSGDGREIVAGAGDNGVYVYDIDAGRTTLRIEAHENDVNAVCFGDVNSPHILYSGSDDTTLKVWDRRSMGDGRPAGVFLGHTEGLTYVDSKGDGRYVLSNAKDQTAKLWDLRKMMSADKAERIDISRYTLGFEYRSNHYPQDEYMPHPHDCSLVTFRGHQVLKTLIRCHFSPPGSSDSRYVYSGSFDGSVYVWNLDATLAGKVDVLAATRNSRPRDTRMPHDSWGYFGNNHAHWSTCVRDASWHPNAPIIAATSWNGWGISQGTCTVHTWNDGLDEDEAEPKVGRRVNARLAHDERLYRPSGHSGRDGAWHHSQWLDEEESEEEEASEYQYEVDEGETTENTDEDD
ncbi:WD40 repeat-like protein [Westerdykella ornata]|uniref:WD40 repeat-like protein n=1 Tax=Westerdykella ornata TaxID=318751 RepID=A0A6A6JJK7_WESOR|nr:WD40 repeat-like protein [Westerdykella ornata]KAF2275876.1 WD40 repeat-like protein [Westerdykella ornata]